MRNSKWSGFTMIELLIVLAITIVLAAFLLPVFAQSREQARVAACISNERQIYLALKMYEGDYGALPVHAGEGTDHWQTKIHPYVKNKKLFVCPSDRTNGETRRWGGRDPCTYIYYYTLPNLQLDDRNGLDYRQPTITSPLLGCNEHRGYQMVLCRYDGSVELAPPFRYPEIGIEFQ